MLTSTSNLLASELTPIPSKKIIEVVVKITERCNINCTYCYMFNKGNNEYQDRPAYMSVETVSSLAKFLAQGIDDLDASEVHIIFHGGEPMMMKSRHFDRVCADLDLALRYRTNLRFSMQTNAMLVSDEWLDVLIKHGVGVGVSIDGPAIYHDIDRLDHRGRGTHSEVTKGILKLQQAHNAGLLNEVGTISVIRPGFSGQKVYNHLVEELGIRNLSFLLPIDSHDSFDGIDASGYGRYLTEVYGAWLRGNDKSVRVRLIDESLGVFLGGRRAVERIHTQQDNFSLFVVGSNGDLEQDDSMKVVNAFTLKRQNIKTSSLIDFIRSSEMQAITEAIKTLPKGCIECCWRNVCQGSAGRLVNRYSAKNGFDNQSFLCSGLKEFYGSVVSSLLRAGISEEKILDALEARPLPTINGLGNSQAQKKIHRTIPIKNSATANSRQSHN